MDSPEPFDPFTQSFTLLLADGTPFSLSLSDVDDFVLYHVQISINFAAQLGASCILLLALLVLTKPDKRRSPVFILNALALILNVIRNVLQCLYYTGHFSEVYAYFGQDYSRVPTSEYATSIAASVFALLVLICIEASLILQIRVVCFLVAKSYRQAIFTLSAIIALLAIGFRLALCVQNSRFILTLKPPTSLQWLESASDITRSISICWFCAVFITKLGFALHERRQLGIKRFGPMQIIFIMGCQTMIVPGKKKCILSNPDSMIFILIKNLFLSSSYLHPTPILHPYPRHVLQRPHRCRSLPAAIRTLGFQVRLQPQRRAARYNG